MKHTGLSRASIHSYLPYTKGIYNAAELSLNAERCRTYKIRQGRSVRLDILAVDRQNQVYNIEIQRDDKDAGVKRARYNSIRGSSHC